MAGSSAPEARCAVWILAALLAFSTAGCSSRTGDALAPTALMAVGTSVVDMLVVTTRAPSGRIGAPYGGERGSRVALDHMVVSIPPEAVRHVGEIQWPQATPADPATSFAVVESQSLDTNGARNWFHRSGRHRVLIFVHGFGTRHEEAVFRFAQLVHDTGTDFVPVLFSWPSRGSIWAYDYDKESTNWSRDALEGLLRQAVADPSVSDVTVLAHSMGSWLAVEAVRQIAIADGKVPAKIGNVILASPDLDVDVFGRQIERIGKGPRFTLFVSGDDRALKLSRFIAGGIERLGSIDPFAEPRRSILEKQGVTVLDLTALKGGDTANHDKFSSSPAVVRLLGERLLAGQPVSDPQIGVGDQVGALVVGGLGVAGSLAVRAPIYILEGTRRQD